MSALHPSHLADLQKSGLTDETIRAAGLYTVPPDEVGKRLGGLANGVVLALAFPYPGCDGYERYKVWREETADPKAPKYLQKTGTPNCLYLPPTVDLEGDSPLILVEGEKKALALWQAEYQVVGIGGVFNWLTKGDKGDSRPITDLDLVIWRRPVIILFDSDGSDNPRVRLAAFRLAQELSSRGAQATILFLPPGPNGEKVGADDYLVAHGSEALGDLLKTAWTLDPTWNDHEAEVWWQVRDLTPETPTIVKLKALSPLVPILAKLLNLEAAALLEELRERLQLRAKDLNGLAADLKAARKAREKKDKIPTSEVKDLEEGFRLHPAIDFLEGAMSIGFRVNLPENDTGLLLLISDGQGVRAGVNLETIEIGERVYQVMQNTVPPFVQDVWNLDRLKAFLEHPTRPQELYRVMVEAFKKYLDLPESAYGLLTAWTVGTYFAHLFTAFPFLQFHGPKESGKSKSLEALCHVCLNAWKGRDITPAALGDTADGLRGTLLLDQAEKLNNDKETGNLIGLLADSYKKAGGQRRVVEVTRAGRSVLEFSTYGPKAFASTKNLDPDLADRCVKVPMTRTRRRLPDLEGWEPIWGELRDKLYRFTLASFKEVQAHYQAIPGDGTRIGELWRPLLAVLLALGVEQAEVEAVRALFMEGAEEGRHELTSWEIALFEALKTKSEGMTEPFKMSAQEILEAMALGEEGPGPKWVGEMLARFHLFIRRKQPRVEGRRTRVYEFSPARVRELCEIYFRDPPSNDLCHLCQGEKPSNGAGERGTGEECGTCANPCQLEEMAQMEQVGTCAGNVTCATESHVNSHIPKVEQVEQVKSGGPSEKNINLFAGDEVEL